MKQNLQTVIILLLLLTSCSKDDKKLKITDFSKSQTIKVKPYKNYPYSMMNIWIKGYVNDTILIKLNSKDSKPILKLIGQINERWYTDYYGEGEQILLFEPYRANSGELEIKIKL